MPSAPKSHSSMGEFTSKLSRYSALTVGGVAGTMAVFESSEAANVVTSTLITITNNATSVPNAMINLDGDANDDVQITVVSSSLLIAAGMNGAALAGTVGGFTPGGSFFYPTGFQASQLVRDRPGQIFSGSGVGAPTNTFGTLANGSTFGHWAGVAAVDGYVGVQFQIGANTHFGWVHVNWDPATDTATIDSYAYNNTPDAASHVPEPSALTLLGLGALGLAARRRRREQD